MTYTNYDSTASAQKWNGGTPVNPTQAEINASTNSIGYVHSVNVGSGLCGFSDWRLPTKDELLGIRDASQASAPNIDSTWFPNTQAAFHWSSSLNVDNSSYYASGIDFGDGFMAPGHWATTRVALTTSLLTPHSSLLTPHSASARGWAHLPN